MIRRFALLSLFTLFVKLTLGQYTALGLSARAAFDRLEENQAVELVLISDDAALSEALKQASIPYRVYFEKYYRIVAKKEDRTFLESCALIQATEPLGFAPRTLNDTMRSNNRVTALHVGNKPFKKAYSGNGVVLGFIDTGIDFGHPDFQDSSGNTRVIRIWDQAADTLVSNRIPSFGYGQLWDSADINAGNCPHDDDILSHGTNVAGIAAGNGLALNQYYGVATGSDIVFVASDFTSSNWLQTVADGVEFVFKESEKMQKQCVINISAGEYLGSHDGTDLAALRIDSMVKASSGRLVVAAAGNAGNIPFHLGYQVTADTNFTWFKYHPNSALGFGTVYYQLWADTADFSNVSFAFGANKNGASFQFRGRTDFDQISNRLNMVVTDSIRTGTHLLAKVETFAQVIGDKYFLEVNIRQPDSNQYLYSLICTGSGQLDVWSDTWLGTSNIYKSPLPSPVVLPSIQHYKAPDTLQTMVSSFTCLPSTATVANYVNRNAYLDVNNNLQTFPVTPGLRAYTSSLGPNRKGHQKPDLIASGDYTLTANRLASIPLHIANNQSDRIGSGGKHKRNGGTSMAAPVVAGVAALLLEECPNLDYNDILSKLIAYARADAQTGVVPNYSYGHGKVDAASAMENMYFISSIVPKDSVLFCETSVAELTGPGDMLYYQWSTGDSTRNVYLDTSLVVTLMTVDSNGCHGIPDTVRVISVQNPVKPNITIVALNILESSKGAGYQWYRNGISMMGETKKTLALQQDGFYSVQVFDHNNCSSFSDSLEMHVGIVELNRMLTASFSPNPSPDGLFEFKCASCAQNDIFHLKVYSSQGSLVFSDEIQSGVRISLQMHSGALYFYEAFNASGARFVGKLMRD